MANSSLSNLLLISEALSSSDSSDEEMVCHVLISQHSSMEVTKLKRFVENVVHVYSEEEVNRSILIFVVTFLFNKSR